MIQTNVEAPLVLEPTQKSYSITAPNSQRAIDEAANNDLYVIFPADDELLIDIDNDVDYALYKEHIEVIRQHIGVLDEDIRPSRSGDPQKKHIRVKLDNVVTMSERIALQACLGSDRLREVLGYVQYKNDDPHPVLFLENKTPITQEVQ